MMRFGRPFAHIATVMVVIGVVIVAVVMGAFVPTARAVPQTSGPAVTMDKTVVVNGDRVDLQISGFTSPFVVIAVCGNEARRGSGDCNLLGSQGLRLNSDGSSKAAMYIVEPPVPCPCVLRVANQTNDEVAISPITLKDHPSAPVVDPPIVGNAVGLAIAVRSQPSGVIDAVRAAMGGDARYEVTVRATNHTTVPLRRVALFGAVGRGATDDLATMDIPNPDEILPGQTWTEVVYVRVPSPTFGRFTFRVSATGAGPIVVASATTKHHTPVLLALTLVVALLLAAFALSRLIRRRQRREAEVAGSARRAALYDNSIPVEERVPHLTS